MQTQQPIFFATTVLQVTCPSFEKLQINDWLKIFWKWLEKSQNSLKLFENLHILPFKSDNSQDLKFIKLRCGKISTILMSLLN